MKKIFEVNFIIMIISIIIMIVNHFITALPDIAIRIIGILLLINIFVFSFTAVKLKKQ